MKLNQEMKAKEGHLEQCYARMERGQPPSDEIEQEWLRCFRDEVNKTKTIKERQKVTFYFPTSFLCFRNVQFLVLLGLLQDVSNWRSLSQYLVYLEIYYTQNN